jgi:hypothetical protein
MPAIAEDMRLRRKLEEDTLYQVILDRIIDIIANIS